jgi:signal transduction histidine kinase
MRWSIRFQLLVPLLLLLVGVAGITTWTAWASARYAWRQTETRVQNVAHTLGDAQFPLTPKVLDQAKGLSGADFVFLTPDGRRVSTQGADQETALFPESALTGDWQTLRLDARVYLNGRSYFCSGLRLSPPRSATTGTLYILYPEALWKDALNQAIRPALLIGGFAGLAALVLAVLLSGRLSRRISLLEQQTRSIAAGDFRPLALAGGNDEIRDLGRSINDMAEQLARLQQAIEKQERLRLLGQVSGGLAHQLRNGVTGAVLAVQLHARDCAGGDGEALKVALRQLALVEANLKRFLDLGRDQAVAEPCSLVELLDEAVALQGPQARHAGVELRWEPPETSPIVDGNRSQLGHLFLNLIGNAVEAAGPLGRVEIRLQQAERCIIEVIDSGPGPPPEIHDRLFQPFVTGKRDGVGLGLAVARQVAEAHGGSITWQRSAGGTCFRVELPWHRQLARSPLPSRGA